MIRWMSAAILVFAATGCSRATEPASQTTIETPSASTFTGAWRSVTPSLEFIRLSVVSKSSEIGVLATRLTFSGVAWEGSGRIEGDSYVASMTVVGRSTPSGVMVARAREGGTLRVQMRPAGGATTDLTFVRED